MIISKAKKNEPWVVESFWEWIPKEKRKMKEEEEILEQKILPYEKIYSKDLPKSKQSNDNIFDKQLKETLHIKQFNMSPSQSKERPQTAHQQSYKNTKKTLSNNFMKDSVERNIFSQDQMRDLKPFSNKEIKRVEEEKRKKKEFLKFETEAEAKDKNKNLLYFNARFSHKKVEDLYPYKVPNGWEKTPLIEEMPQSPQKGRIPDDILAQAHIEGNKIKQKEKIVFYKDKNEAVSSIGELDHLEEKLKIEDIQPNQNDNSKKNIFTNKKLQDQRESVKIQKEINQLIEKNKQINPKTGKQAFGVQKSKEVNQFMDMRKMMKVSTKIDTMFKKIKERGFSGGNEFGDEHMEEMNEIKEKLQNRSIDEDLEQELAELEYGEGKKYEDKINKKKKKLEKKDQKTQLAEGQDNNDEQDLFGEEDVEKGDQAVGLMNVNNNNNIKKTTFLTQEKVESVPFKISKSKNTKLKSTKAQQMEDLMNEIDLGDDEFLEEYEYQINNTKNQSTAQAEQENEDNNLSDSLEEKPKKQQNKKDNNKFTSKRVQFFNGKMIRKPLEEEDLIEQKKESKSNIEKTSNILEDKELVEDNNEEKENEKEIESVKSIRNRNVSQNDTNDLGEEKKQLWQQDILQGHHRAYLDDKQNFNTDKFLQDIDEETRDKCKLKVLGDIQKLEDRTNKKIDLIKGGSTYKRSSIMKEKSEKLDKINSKFKKSIQQFKQTIDQSKQETAVIERKPSQQQLLEKSAKKMLKETQKNSASQKQLKLDNATVNELSKREFKFSQREKANDDEPHPWM